MSFPPPFYRWRPHPWHGLDIGQDPPKLVHAYIEITPYDFAKYEVDKITGYLRVDRPQRTSSQPPTLYGFIPRTYGGARVAKLSEMSQQGDQDPLDICVLSERQITKAEVIVNALVVGGLQIIDNNEADDKIIAVLENDNVWGHVRDISELPDILVERLRHYFSTYKLVPGEASKVTIEKAYGVDHAHKVVCAGIEDYEELFGS
jgi:inorganic pyrophosphatase